MGDNTEHQNCFTMHSELHPEWVDPVLFAFTEVKVCDSEMSVLTVCFANRPPKFSQMAIIT